MNEKSREELIATYFSEAHSSNDELLAQCKDDPQLLEEICQLKVIERLLPVIEEDHFVNEISERLNTEESDEFVAGVIERVQPTQEVKSWPISWIAAAACLIFLPLVLLDFNSQDSMVAKVESVGAQWESGNPSIGENISLAEGYSQLTLTNGVELILEAPIKMAIGSDHEVMVKEGSVVAKVPKSVRRFLLKTPHSEVINLEGEFGVTVNEKGASDIHAFSGQLKVSKRNSTDYHLLEEAEAAQFDEYQQMTKIISKPSHFMRALPGKSAEKPNYLHWSFDKAAQEIECSGPGIMGQKYPARTATFNNGEGPRFESGQYGQGIYFNGQDAYVETDFKGIGGNKPRTVAFWVKVPKEFSLSNGYGIVSWGLMEKGAAWQISPNPTKKDGLLGRLRIGTHKGMVIGTTDLRDDEWHHVAIVMYGGDAAEVSTHILMYIDGQLERTSKKSVARISTGLYKKDSKSLMIGKNLGFNESEKQGNKFFKGWLDELFIFDAALSDEQIRSLMNSNKLPQKGEL